MWKSIHLTCEQSLKIAAMFCVEYDRWQNPRTKAKDQSKNPVAIVIRFKHVCSPNRSKIAGPRGCYMGGKNRWAAHKAYL